MRFRLLETNEGCPHVQKHYEADSLQREATGDGVVWLTIKYTDALEGA